MLGAFVFCFIVGSAFVGAGLTGGALLDTVDGGDEYWAVSRAGRSTKPSMGASWNSSLVSWIVGWLSVCTLLTEK